MIDPDHPQLPIVRQCNLVSLSRSSYYYAGRGESFFNRQVMRRIDEQFLATPWYGSRQMTRHPAPRPWGRARKRVRSIDATDGTDGPLSQAADVASPDGSHRVYPYRLGHLRIERPN